MSSVALAPRALKSSAVRASTSIAPLAEIELVRMPSTRPSMSLVALAVRSASLRTSSATTAKPRPASPARAASMAALRASRLVWSAISWMSWTMALISLACWARPSTSLAVLTEFSASRCRLVAISVVVWPLLIETWAASRARAFSSRRRVAMVARLCWEPARVELNMARLRRVALRTSHSRSLASASAFCSES